MSPPDDFDQRLEWSQKELLERFRHWGAGEREVEDVQLALPCLGPIPLFQPSPRDVMEFLWGTVPRKFMFEEADLESLRTSLVRFLEFCKDDGADADASLAVARDRVTFLRRIRSHDGAGPEWYEELRRSLEATGMEPALRLPDGFEWALTQGNDEFDAYELLKEVLTLAVRDRQFDPATEAGRRLSAAKQMAWLDTPHERFGGRTPRVAVLKERDRIERQMSRARGGGRRRRPDPLGRQLGECELNFQPVALPGDDELVKAAAAAPLVEHVRVLLDIVGEGSRLTQRGYLAPDDGRRLVDHLIETGRLEGLQAEWAAKARSSSDTLLVDLVYRWTRRAGLLRVAHGLVLPTRKGRSFGRDPLEDWWNLFTALLRPNGFMRFRWPDDRPFWTMDLEELAPVYLELLYLEAGDTVPIAVMGEDTWGTLGDRFRLGGSTEQQLEAWRGWVEADIEYALFRPLGELGATVTEVDPGSEERPLLAPRQVRATPLGLWATRRLIETRWGVSPPAAGELAARAGTAEGLVALAAEHRLTAETFVQEVRRWSEGRPEAVAGLVDVLTLGGPSGLLAQAALDAFEPEAAEPHVRRLAETTSGGAAYMAAAWLDGHGFAAPGIARSSEAAAEAMLWTIVAITRDEGPMGVGRMLATMGPEDEQLAVVERIARSTSPFAEEGLEAIAAGHPSKGVRKAARSALHRVRSRPR